MSKSGSKTDVPVGTKFMYRNVMLEVIDTYACRSCYFNHKRSCNTTRCASNKRKDSTSVTFKQIPITNE